MEDKSQVKERSFMLPIWIITLASMFGTFLVSYAIHLYYLKERHTENQEQIENVNFRAKKYTEYKNIIEKDGLDAAIRSLQK